MGRLAANVGSGRACAMPTRAQRARMNGPPAGRVLWLGLWLPWAVGRGPAVGFVAEPEVGAYGEDDERGHDGPECAVSPEGVDQEREGDVLGEAEPDGLRVLAEGYLCLTLQGFSHAGILLVKR